MNKNITISDLNVEIHRQGNNFRRHLVAKIGIFVIEFLLACVFYCYGIILSEYVLIGSLKYGEGIWTSILFICSWSFTDPIARFITEYFDDKKNILFRCIAGGSTAILFIGIMIPDNLTLYMVFGGILSNIISAQIRSFALDKIDMDYKIFEGYRQVTRAISMFIMPHFVFALVLNYEINQVKMIFGAILLNIIPAALIATIDRTWLGEVPSEMSRYQTIGRFSHQMNEMKNFNKEDDKSDEESSSSEETPVFEINPHFFPTQNRTDSQTVIDPDNNQDQHDQSSGVQNYGSVDVNDGVKEIEIPASILNALHLKAYYYNVNGVSILPGIPEENEDETEDINFINPKRLSRISDKLEVLNAQDQIRRESIKEIFCINEVINENRPEPINTIEYIANFREEKKTRISVLDELKHLHKARHCFHCSPYRKYIWTRRLRTLRDFSNDNFLRPLYHALKNLYFYPSLTTKILTNLVSTLYITLAPFMAMQKSWKQNLIFSTENATFLLTYIAFAWCFFLVTLPLVLKLSYSRIRIVFGFGLVISGTSLWLISGKLTNDVITLSSLLFGFGYGIITYTEKIVFRASIGMRPWYLVKGPLEVLSGVFIIIIYFLIYFHRLELNLLLLLAALSYYFNAILWVCLPSIKYCSSIIIQKVIFDERSQQEGFFH